MPGLIFPAICFHVYVMKSCAAPPAAQPRPPAQTVASSRVRRRLAQSKQLTWTANCRITPSKTGEEAGPAPLVFGNRAVALQGLWLLAAAPAPSRHPAQRKASGRGAQTTDSSSRAAEGGLLIGFFRVLFTTGAQLFTIYLVFLYTTPPPPPPAVGNRGAHCK